MKSTCNPWRMEGFFEAVKLAMRRMKFKIEQADLWMENRVEEIIIRWEDEQEEIN